MVFNEEKLLVLFIEIFELVIYYENKMDIWIIILSDISNIFVL